MEHPPGLVYLFKRLHFLLLPPIAVYLAFNVAKQYLGLCIPKWIFVVTILLARPTLTFVRNQYTDSNNRKRAAALGAVLPPHVQESPFTVAKKAFRVHDGFPGLPSSSILFCCLPTYFRLKGNSWLRGQKTMDILSVLLDSQAAR
jgi:hypothetical protein